MKDTEEIHQKHQYRKFTWEALTFPWEGRMLSWEEWLQLPWEEWIRRARDGDTEATNYFCLAAKPFIWPLCQWPLLTDKLGRNEVRSMAALAMIEFLMTYRGPFGNRKIPILLRRYVRCVLLDNLRRLNSRRRFEAAEDDRDKDNLPVEEMSEEPEDPDPEANPEEVLLQDDYCSEVRNATNSLKRNEQAVIHSIYFQRKSIREISHELAVPRNMYAACTAKPLCVCVAD